MSTWLICGGREFTDYELMYNTLKKLCDERGEPDHVITGGARGADTLGWKWAQAKHIKFSIEFADWTQYGNRAGPIRNMAMLTKYKPDLVIAFPGGKGTAHMKWISKEAGVEVIEISK